MFFQRENEPFCMVHRLEAMYVLISIGIYLSFGQAEDRG